MKEWIKSHLPETVLGYLSKVQLTVGLLTTPRNPIRKKARTCSLIVSLRAGKLGFLSM